eukprot:3962360-Pyramimonas_sp.AAC.1
MTRIQAQIANLGAPSQCAVLGLGCQGPGFGSSLQIQARFGQGAQVGRRLQISVHRRRRVRHRALCTRPPGCA